jgi:hypothetical protein
MSSHSHTLPLSFCHHCGKEEEEGGAVFLWIFTNGFDCNRRSSQIAARIEDEQKLEEIFI